MFVFDVTPKKYTNSLSTRSMVELSSSIHSVDSLVHMCWLMLDDVTEYAIDYSICYTARYD